MSLMFSQFQTIRFVQMGLTFGLFTQVSDSRPHGPLVSLMLLLLNFEYFPFSNW